MVTPGYFAHESAVIDEGAEIGEGTRIWHFCHVMPGARIGRECVLGQNVFIAGVTIGDRVRIQNNVSIYEGVTLNDDVFCGPSCVFTNVRNPRAEIRRDRATFEETVVERGASIGANATIVCGARIGPYAFIGAGAVVRGEVPAHAVMVGVPARQVGWMCCCGARLGDSLACGECGRRFEVGPRGLEHA